MPDPDPRTPAPISTCARPGCAAPVAAWLTYDYGARRLWLDDGYAAGNCWPLCSGHAARLRAPKGWTQLDRRAGALPN
jgi:hypothetical protein